MTICPECEQFETRIKKWNRTHGAVDPLPFIDEIVEPHKHLVFEGRTRDGAGGYMLTFQCLRCDWWWKVSAWGLLGTLSVWPEPLNNKLVQGSEFNVQGLYPKDFVNNAVQEPEISK